MADSAIEDLTDDPSPSSDDLLITVNDPGGTPTNRKVTIGNLNAALSIASASDAADFATVADLASTANGDGASTVGVEDSAGNFTGDNVEAVLVEIADDITTLQNAGYITATLTQEQVEDYVGGMLTGNTETLITVTYQDADGTIDFVVDNDLANYSNANSGFAVAADLASTATSAGASLIGVEDSGGNFTGDNIEAVLAEVASDIDTLESAGYITDVTGDNLSALADVTITTIASGEVLKWNGTAWVNNTLAEAGIAAASHNHSATEITSGELAHERGGLEADVSAYSGLVKISAGATSQVTDNSTNWNTAFGWGDHASAGYVANTTQVIAGDGLSDGGALSGNVTLNVDIAGQTENVSPGSTDWVLVENNAGGTFRKVQLTNLPGGGSGIASLVEDTSPQLGGDLDTNGSDIVAGNGDGLLTGTTAGNTLLLGAYDVDGTAYKTFVTLTANNTPTMNLDTAVTIDNDSIVRVNPSPSDNEIVTFNGTTGLVDGNAGLTYSATARLYVRTFTSSTNTVDLPLRVSAITSGSATTGYGAGVDMYAENASGNEVQIGTLEWAWTTATDAAEVSDLVGYVYEGGAKTEAFRADTSANLFDLPTGWQFAVNGTPLSSGGLGNVVEDTTPQLGGDLDLNGNVITGLEIGTDVQAYDADLDTWAGVTPGTGVATALAVNVGSAGAVVVNGGALGTPSSGTLTNATGYPGDSSLTTVGTVTSGNVDAVVSAASTTTAGKVELATAAEIDAGTDATRVMSPDAFAASDFGVWYFEIEVFELATDVATGDKAAKFHIPPALDGADLVYAHAEVDTAGTTGTTDIQIHNVDNALDMLSTKLTVDSGETGSDTAATAAVINTSNDHVNTNDVIRIDVDAISTTPPKGLLVTLGFRKP